MSADKIPARPGKETIYIDVDDEITTIIDKVEIAKQKVVALVLPKRSTALQSIVNMRLLKRSADSAAKNIVLITSEEALMPLAGAAGIHVARNLQSKPDIPNGPNLINPPSTEDSPITTSSSSAVAGDDTPEEELPSKINYDKSIGELAAVHEIEHPETIELGDEDDPVETAAKSTEKLPKAPKDKALKVPNFDKFRLFLGLGIAGLIALIVFIYLAIAVLPKATIAITTTSTPVSASFTLATSGSAKSYDPTSKTVPGYSQKSTQSADQQVQATGQQNNGQKATGAVTLVNCSSPAQPVTVPAGTGISSNGLTFITQSAVNMPLSGESGGSCTPIDGSSSGATNVISQSGGTKYNLSSGSDFTVAGYSSVSGSNDKDFTGGTDSIQTVVSQSDVDNAKQKLSTTDTTNKFAKDFENQLSQQGYYVLVSTLKQSDPSVSANPAVNQPASNTTVTVKVTFTVLAIKNADLKQAISDALSNQIDKSKQKIDDNKILTDASVSVAGQSSATDASLNITEDTSAIPLVDAGSIKKMAEGQKSGTITSSISSIPGVKTVNVKLSPFWVSKVPSKPSKITVNIQHIANGS